MSCEGRGARRVSPVCLGIELKEGKVRDLETASPGKHVGRVAANQGTKVIVGGATSSGRHGRLATHLRRCVARCRGYHLNLDAERIERCDDCAVLTKDRFDDLDAARLVLALDDQFVCDVDDDGSPITLHSLARNTLDQRRRV